MQSSDCIFLYFVYLIFDVMMKLVPSIARICYDYGGEGMNFQVVYELGFDKPCANSMVGQVK